MDTVGKNHGNELRDAGEKQIGMKGFIIAGFAAIQAKAVLIATMRKRGSPTPPSR